MTVADVLVREADGGADISVIYGAPGRSRLVLIAIGFIWAIFLAMFLYSLVLGDLQVVGGRDLWPLFSAPPVLWVYFKIITLNADRNFSKMIGLLKVNAKGDEVTTAA